MADRTENLLVQVLGQVNALTEKRAADSATLTGLVRSVERQREDFIRADQDSKEHRQDVRNDIGKLKEEVGAFRMEQAHQNLQTSDITIALADMKKKVDKFEDRELIKLGGNRVLTYLSRFALVALGGLASAGGALFQHWLTRGH